MHIPDGFLDTKTIIATSAFSLAGISRALRNITKHLPARKIPLMGLSAAFIFVAQMLNFPVGGGTSGHLLGAVLVAVLLGPAASILVMTIVLAVQCLLFADGGVLALGANIFNMAIIGTLSGYFVYRTVRRIIPGEFGFLAAVPFAAWCSTVVAAVCCAGELAWSGIIPWSIGFPAMTGVHMLIGIGESIITTLVIAAMYSTRPDLFIPSDPDRKRKAQSVIDVVIYGGIVVMGLVLFVTPFASSWPDGLEKIAAQFGFASREAGKPLVTSPFSQYRVPGMGSLTAATALSGLIGAVIVLGVSLALAWLMMKKSTTQLTPDKQENGGGTSGGVGV